MWVPQLGRHVELEVLAVLHDRISELDAHDAPLLEELLLQQALKSWIQGLTNVLEQHRISILNAGFQRSQVV